MLINIMTACGAAVGLLLATHLFSIRRNVAAVFLGLYVLSLSVLAMESLTLYFGLPKKIVGIALAISTLAIGPSLYLYCRARIRNSFNALKDVWHFLPAAILAFLIAVSSDDNVAPANSDEEVWLYFLFNFQVLVYLMLCMRLVANNAGTIHFYDRMPLLFMRLLTYGSFVLFSHSLLQTILHTNHGSRFVTTVQVLLNILLVIIALLTTEELQRRPRREWIDDRFSSLKPQFDTPL